MAAPATPILRAPRAALALLLTLAAHAVAGPLNPPAGPVTPSFKTLSDVEPRTAINATNTPGDADSVFKITQAGSYYLTANVIGAANKYGIEITASGVTIDLRGYSLLGTVTSYSGIAVTANARHAITVKDGSVIGWGAGGVNLNLATNIRVIDVLANGNDSDGISVGRSAVVTGCSAESNTGYGIITLNAAVVTHCTARLNTLSGIRTSETSTISDCAASENGSHGIEAGARNLVTGCSSGVNGGDGIHAFTHTTVRANTCSGNKNALSTGAGIRATSSDNRIEENNCIDNNRGISIDSSGNFVTRNTCSGNTTNWSAVVGNVCLVVNAAGSPAVSGNSGGASPGSTDPNANFTY